MAWYDAIKRLASTVGTAGKEMIGAVDGEYDRRIRTASNVKAYHPEGHGHGHHALADAGAHGAIEEEGGGAGTEGAFHGSAGSEYSKDPAAEVIAQH